MPASYTTRRGAVSIRKILDCPLHAYTPTNQRISGRGVDFIKRHPNHRFYFTDQERLRAIGESLAAVGGRSLLNSTFGDLIDRNVCVGYAWDGIAGFWK